MSETRVKTFSVGFVNGTSSDSLEVLDRKTNEIDGAIVRIEDTFVPEMEILVRAVVYSSC